MDTKYFSYCGLYSENCAVKAKITPAAKVLYNEMKSAGFEEIIHMIPGVMVFGHFSRTWLKTEHAPHAAKEAAIPVVL
ncbi:MAG TPA: hypothetical protein VJY43_04500 [Methanocorpusculum sp.]|nr:hypothetical protein [Methanocorpusculum sp.]